MHGTHVADRGERPLSLPVTMIVMVVVVVNMRGMSLPGGRRGWRAGRLVAGAGAKQDGQREEGNEDSAAQHADAGG